MKNFIFPIAIIIFLNTKGQIPNSGFELWTASNGYNTPNDWGNLNSTTQPYSVYTCYKLSPGNPGNNYLSVVSLSIAGKGVVPGRVVSGKIDTLTYKPISGFAFNLRPTSLSYNMKYMVALPIDTAYVLVTLTKWNSVLMKRDTIASGKNIYNAMAHSWVASNLNINYYSNDAPDSACIVISASSSNPLNNSSIKIDNLQFNGGTTGAAEYENLNSKISVYPNPSTNALYVHLGSDLNQILGLSVIDFQGNIYYRTEKVKPEECINVSHWPEGIYFIEFSVKQGTFRKKLIIN